MNESVAIAKDAAAARRNSEERVSALFVRIGMCSPRLAVASRSATESTWHYSKQRVFAFR
jgi:hypothetical protein